MLDLDAYEDADGNRPYAEWFDQLDSFAAAEVSLAVTRLERGSSARTQSVGAGVSVYEIDYEEGYRVYFAKDGRTRVVLLAGGTAAQQEEDGQIAQARWEELKKRKTKEQP